MTTDVAAICAGRVYDKTGREIMVGDVLRVFHFVGARWCMKYFMHKQVMRELTLGQAPDASRYFFVSHLNLKSETERDSGYHIALDGSILADTEIVQGLDWHHDRPSAALQQNDEGEGPPSPATYASETNKDRNAKEERP